MTPYNVLFLCTGNSARSIFAEAILNKIGRGKFRAWSAGSNPKGEVNPHALALLQRLNFPIEGYRSKSWDEFARPSAPELDFVFTVCDNAANEVCPVWPGQPMTAHWGVPDPAAVTGSEEQLDAAFREAFFRLQRRIELFANLRIDSLDRMALKRRVDAIGAHDTAMHKVERGSTLAQTMVEWLTDERLPTVDLWDSGGAYFAFGDTRDPDGFGGTVRSDNVVLLRSIVVNPARRKHGLGARIVEQLVAAHPGADVWLLTTSAEPFFARQGFGRVAREDAPPAVAASAQFQGLCSASAALMHRRA